MILFDKDGETKLNLSERIKIILKENCLKQKEFAAELGVTESYISSIVSGRNLKISQALATLIEEKYGYSSSWVLSGVEPKLKSAGKTKTLSHLQQRVIFQIEQLSAPQVKAVLAFVKSLEEVEDILKK